jgi:ubiquinone/menaquinone biosynthesis C-methylase UbiE
MLDAALGPEQARRAYRRLGTALNLVGVYENIATRKLLRYTQLESAQNVFELGCGTGAFAEMILEKHLPDTARYRAIDVTPEMVESARARTQKFGERVRIELSDGLPPTSESAGTYDRFLSNYVFDLLSESDIHAMLYEAHRMLRPGGLLCLSGLAPGRGPLSNTCVGLWTAIYRFRPTWVGGCRPVELHPFIDARHWSLRHHEVVIPLGFPLEILVAERLG